MGKSSTKYGKLLPKKIADLIYECGGMLDFLDTLRDVAISRAEFLKKHEKGSITNTIAVKQWQELARQIERLVKILS